MMIETQARREEEEEKEKRDLWRWKMKTHKEKLHGEKNRDNHRKEKEVSTYIGKTKE